MSEVSECKNNNNNNNNNNNTAFVVRKFHMDMLKCAL